MSEEARKFVNGLRKARNVTVKAMVAHLDLTVNQYYYRLRSGKEFDWGAAFDAVICLENEVNLLPLHQDQIDAFRRAFNRMENTNATNDG